MAIDASIPLRAGSVANAFAPRYDPVSRAANVLGIQSMQDRQAYEAARRNALAASVGPDGEIDYDVAQANLAAIGDVPGAMAIEDRLTAREVAAQKRADGALGRGLERMNAAGSLYRFAKGSPERYASAFQFAEQNAIPAFAGLPTPDQWTPETDAALAKAEHGLLDLAKRRELEMGERRTRATEANVDLARQRLTFDRAKQLDSAQQQDRAAGREMYKSEQDFARRYDKASTEFRDVRSAYARVREALKTADSSAAATLAAGTSFAKMLDPGSVVRESELGMVLQAQGAWDRAAAYLKSLQDGRVLSKAQVDDFQDIAARIYEAAAQTQRELRSQYEQDRERYGFHPSTLKRHLPPEPPKTVDGDTFKVGKYTVRVVK